MGPEGRTQKVLREALSKGADRCIHIVEDNARETDPLQTAKILSSALKDEQFDLILSGLQSLDLGMGQTGVILGELLGMSTASLVMATELTNDSIRVKRELESGWFQWVTLRFGLLIHPVRIKSTPVSITERIMGAKKKEIKALYKRRIN